MFYLVIYLHTIYYIYIITVELINNLLSYTSPRTPVKFPSKISVIKVFVRITHIV